jgi:hypothetical protein
VALLQHLERQQEFLPELLLAPPQIGLRRQRADGVVRKLGGAVAGLAPPDCQNHRARDAEALLDRRERRSMLGQKLATLRGQARQRCVLEIDRGRLHELRLFAAWTVRPSGDHQVRQREIRLKPACRSLEGHARDAERLRLGPRRFQPLSKGCVRRHVVTRREQQNARPAAGQQSPKAVSRGDHDAITNRLV